MLLRLQNAMMNAEHQANLKKHLTRRIALADMESFMGQGWIFHRIPEDCLLEKFPRFEEFLHIVVPRKCFPTGKCKPCGKRFQTETHFPTGKLFPARKLLPNGKCFTDEKPFKKICRISCIFFLEEFLHLFWKSLQFFRKIFTPAMGRSEFPQKCDILDLI